MSLKQSLMMGIFLLCAITISFAQLPLVYGVENTGASCEAPPLPAPNQLTNYPMLPDPFAWSNGSGRIAGFEEWECRRNEIKAEIEEYEIGPKPDRPANISATLTGTQLTVVVTENGQTLTLTSQVIIPTGTGPFPVVIGMNNPTGSLPSTLFEGVIQIPFMHNQVVTYTQTSTRNTNDPYYKLYPSLTYVGNYSAWAWGVSRLIDGIEIVQSQLNADLSHIAVTGCSYAGKMALFSGAYDERVALTIVQESGGGGINAWRVSETIGNVEKIDNTNYSWFMERMRTNFAGKVGLLPHDHHELMAMVAPRALLVLGNPPFVWLGDESGYVSSRATQEVYKSFDIEDRFGFSFRSGHDHCSLPTASYPEVQAFVDKFLFEDETANTNIQVHEFPNTDYNSWIAAWKEPANPNAPVVTLDSPTGDDVYIAPATITFEASVNDTDDNVTKVEFYNGEEKIGEDTDSPYSFTWTDVGVGTYFISVEAIDAEELRGYSTIINVIVRAPTAEVSNAETPPVIDGAVDAIWIGEEVSTFEAGNVLVGTGIEDADLSGTIKVLWDETNVYLLAEVTDDSGQNDSPNTYEDDNVEVYFDIDNSKSSPYDANDVQYSFGWNDGTTVGALPATRSVTGITYTILDTESGYTVEARIPWTTLQGTPEDGKEIGFDFMINDDDNGAGRDGKRSWNATADQAWQDASLFGTLKLAEKKSEVTPLITELEGGTLILYPNPAGNVLVVEGYKKTFDYQILNVSGHQVDSGQSRKEVRIESLPSGVYFLTIVEGEKNSGLKFIKE